MQVTNSAPYFGAPTCILTHQFDSTLTDNLQEAQPELKMKLKRMLEADTYILALWFCRSVITMYEGFG